MAGMRCCMLQPPLRQAAGCKYRSTMVGTFRCIGHAGLTGAGRRPSAFPLECSGPSTDREEGERTWDVSVKSMPHMKQGW